MFTIHHTPLAGLLTLQPRVFADNRGTFVKTFHHQAFRDMGLSFEPREEYYTASYFGVLRGMHFQVPPADHAKLVYCTSGTVLDVVLDLRRNSPTFGGVFAEELSETNRKIMYIPSGFAHGFLTLSTFALMVYKTTTTHDPAYDKGVHWSSFGFDWPLNGITPILSKRDLEQPPLAEFNTPF